MPPRQKRAASQQISGQAQPKAEKGKKWNQKAASEDPDGAWELRTLTARKWGHKVWSSGGSEAAHVKRLVRTLKDSRAASEGALRRTAIQALIPAAAQGHRGALAAQAGALTDTSAAVRESALASLRAAAGGRRAQQGGAVAVALAEVLPPPAAVYDVEARRAAAAALQGLAPQGDPKMTSIACGWLKDSDPEVRRSATAALGSIGSTTDDVSSIAKQLKDGDWRVSLAAVKSLEQLALGQPEPQDPPLPGTISLKPVVSKASKSSAASAGGAPSSPKGNLRKTGTLKRSSTTMSRAKSGSVSPSSRKNAPSPRRETLSPSSRTRRGRNSTSTGASDLLEGASSAEQQAENKPSHVMVTAVDVLSECCANEGSMYGVSRAEAVAALGRAAVPGHIVAVEAAASRLGDVDAMVRARAVNALVTVGRGDKSRALHEAARQLRNLDWRVRASAGEAMVACADPEGDEQAIKLVADALEQEDWAARRGVAHTLRQMLEVRGDAGIPSVMKELGPRLRHENWSVRRKTALAVGESVRTIGGSKEAVRLLASAAEDPEEAVRCVTMDALPFAAPLKCKEAVGIAVHAATTDSSVEVRIRALRAIEMLASPQRSRSRAAVHGAASALEDENDEVRNLAQQVVVATACGRRTAIDAVVLRFSHQNERVRDAAAEVIGRICGDRVERARSRTIPLLSHPDKGVRRAATRATTAFSHPGESVAIEAAAAVLARLSRKFKEPDGHLLTPVTSEAGDTQDANTSDAGSGSSIGAQGQGKTPVNRRGFARGISGGSSKSGTSISRGSTSARGALLSRKTTRQMSGESGKAAAQAEEERQSQQELGSIAENESDVNLEEELSESETEAETEDENDDPETHQVDPWGFF